MESSLQAALARAHPRNQRSSQNEMPRSGHVGVLGKQGVVKMKSAHSAVQTSVALIACAFMLSTLGGCATGVCRVHEIEGAQDTKLYLYRSDYLEKCLSVLAPDGEGASFYHGPARNGVGTSLYFDSDEQQAVLVVRGDGSVQRLQKPAFRAMLNDDLEFVAWAEAGAYDWTFRGGITRTSANGGIGMEPGGRLYSIATREGTTEVASTDRPMDPLIVSAVPGGTSFCTADEVFLFSHYYSKLASKHGLRDRPSNGLLCQIYRNTGSELLLDKVRAIPRPSHSHTGGFGVEDMDPGSRNVLVRQSFPMPSIMSSRYYLFNLDSQQMKPIGPKGGPWCYSGLFLKEDILGRAMEAHEQRSRAEDK
jgi:hypothetical protein